MKGLPVETSPRRKGAIRRSDILADVLQALNQGREETITLVEWLAIDMVELMDNILPEVGLAHASDGLLTAARELSDEGFTVRLKGIGAALYSANDGPNRTAIFESVAGHRSDMVRAWAAFMLAANTDLALADRLEATRRFAADRGVAVRECAWDSFRPYLAAELDAGLALLESWVRDPDPSIRRCAVESTRPRGVWTAHFKALKEEPERGLRLLEPVRSDPSRYVQRAVANWLNDASKSRPEWMRDVCERWTRESPTPETAWTVHHALRTLRKKERR